MKLPEHFTLTELVGPEVYKYHGINAIYLLDPVAIKVLGALRKTFGPCVVNNWASGGQFKESGHRLMTTKTGAKNSMHKFGMAFDCKFTNVSPDQARRDILADQSYWRHLGLTRLEDGAFAPTWVHFDVKPVPGNEIVIIKP